MKYSAYRPTIFWSWNESITCDEVDWQIESFARQGIGGVFVHARGGLEIPYMGEQWFGCFDACVKACQTHGMDVWIYDEDGWPSGFAGGKVNGLGEEYLFKKMNTSTRKPDVDEQRIIAQYVVENGQYRLVFDDSANFYIYYTVRESYVDLMNPKVTKAFIACTHEEYKKRYQPYFGNVIKGIFTDEPQLSAEGFPYSTALSDKYKELFHRELRDGLYQLFDNVNDWQKFRHDFFTAVNILMKESFTKPINRWCEENNLLFTGHFAVEDGLCYQVSCNGGVMNHYECMGLPGIDHLGRRLAPILLMKQVSSVRNQFKKERIISETFGCSGWDLSFADMCYIWGVQASLGMNLPCLHIGQYSLKGIRKRDYPPAFSYQENWWDQFHYFADFSKNLNGNLSRGEDGADILVLSPLVSAYTQVLVGEKQRNLSQHFRTLLEGLLDIQLQYDLGDEFLLKKYGHVENGTLICGAKRYAYVIVPESISIEHETLELLEEFHAQGGHIVFITTLPNLLDGQENIELANRLENLQAVNIQNRSDVLRKVFDVWQYKRVAEIRSLNYNKLSSGISLNIRREGNRSIVFAQNVRADSDKSGYLIFNGDGVIYEREILTDERKLVNPIRFSGRTACEITLQAREGRLYEFENTDVTKMVLPKTDRVKGFRIPDILSKPLEIDQVEILDKNCITLDYGSCRINNGNYSEVKSVILIQDEIYHGALNASRTVDIRYQFETEVEISDLTLVLELDKVQTLFINGRVVSKNSLGYFVDKCFQEIEIAGYVKIGKNEIVLRYEIPAFNTEVNYDDMEETDKNRFHFPVEPESIYLRGTFDVDCEISDCLYYELAKKFMLKKATAITMGDITKQGKPFYLGRVRVRGAMLQNLNHEESMKGQNLSDHLVTTLEIRDMKCPVAIVAINGQEVGAIYKPPYHLDISKYLTLANNHMEITYYSSNRNLLGPHHTIVGETMYCSPDTFKGKKTYGDYVVNYEIPNQVWMDEYSFVPFDTGIPYIHTQKE